MRLRAAILAGLTLAFGCSSSPKSAKVQFSVQEGCFNPNLSCAGEVGLYLVDAQTGQKLDHRCVAYGADAGRVIDDLPALLSTSAATFSSVSPGKPVQLEIAVFTPAQGCPDPDDGGSPSYFGKSAPTTLTGGAPSLELTLSCLSPPRCPNCTRYASPGASGGDGSSAHPFGTVAQLLAALQPGDTGCLRDGTYSEELNLNVTGTATAPIVLTSDVGARARIAGQMTILPTAGWLTLSNISLDGNATVTSPILYGHDLTLYQDDITNSVAPHACIYLGNSTQVAHNVTLDSNRVHGCGISVGYSTGSHVLNNYIYGATNDYGVQLYPSSQSALVERNVLNANKGGVTFSGDSSNSSSNNTVRDNVISNSTTNGNVTSFWGSAVGQNNVFDHNCDFGGSPSDVVATNGYSITNETLADPQYLEAGAGNLWPRSDGGCAGFGPLFAPP